VGDTVSDTVREIQCVISVGDSVCDTVSETRWETQ
jgi:hypothetical protein